MKIGIIGDTHFGAGYNLGKIDPVTQHNSRLLDYSETFNSIIDRFIKKDVKLVVLTGDIFETRHPTSAQLNAFSKCVQRALGKGLELVVVVGNHDQQRVISTTTVDIFNHLQLDKTTVYSDMGCHSVLGSTNSTKVNLILMPYRDRRMLNAQSNAEAIDILKKQLNQITDGLSGLKIVVGHFMLEKTLEQENPDSFSINELMLPLDMFKGIDATVMGHVHKHSVMSKKDPVIIYSGSMEKVSFGERDHQKATIILDTDDINNYEIIDTHVRNLIEINLDYSEEDKAFKSAINDKILSDVDAFDVKNPIKDSIIRLIVKLKDTDVFHLNQQTIKDHILSKNVNYLSSISVSTVSSRQLRNAEINEGSDVKQAMLTFIKGLTEPDNVKKRLVKYAEEIIEEIEGK